MFFLIHLHWYNLSLLYLSAVLKQASTHKYHDIEDKKCFASIVKKLYSYTDLIWKIYAVPLEALKLALLKINMLGVKNIIEKHIFKIKNVLLSSFVEILFARDSR